MSAAPAQMIVKRSESDCFLELTSGDGASGSICASEVGVAD